MTHAVSPFPTPVVPGPEQGAWVDFVVIVTGAEQPDRLTAEQLTVTFLEQPITHDFEVDTAHIEGPSLAFRDSDTRQFDILSSSQQGPGEWHFNCRVSNKVIA